MKVLLKIRRSFWISTNLLLIICPVMGQIKKAGSVPQEDYKKWSNLRITDLSNNAKHSALNIGKIINLCCKTFSWVLEGPYFAPEHMGICQICTFLTHLGNLSLVFELIKYNSKYAPMPTNGFFIPFNLGCGQLSTQKGTL